MRLSVDQIKQAILHPDWEVRDMALRYFRESFSADPAAMPTLIKAVQTYGWTEACSPYTLDRPLAQSAETVAWLVGQLQLPSPDPLRERLWKSWNRFLSWQLNSAATELLVPHADRFDDLAGLDLACREYIERRLPLAGMDPESGWRELQKFCEQSVGEYELIEFADEDFIRFIEVILRDGNRFADRVLELLDESTADLYEDDPQYWMQAAATELAGRMRLQAAVPRLVERLVADIDDDGQWYCYRCADALIRIGGDDVIRAVAGPFARESWDFRSISSRIFEGIHSECALQSGLELLAGEKDDTLRTYLADSLLYQFDTAVVEPVRDLILRGECGKDEDQMIRRLMAVATLLDVAIPESAPWRERALTATAVHRQSLEEKLNDDGHLPDDWDNELEELEQTYEPFDTFDEFDDDDGDEFEGDDDEDFDEPLDDPLAEDDDAVRPIVRADPKVGRNDPCPCGSGKKFKHCCLNREKNPPKIDW
jgi:hypothetical protein